MFCKMKMVVVSGVLVVFGCDKAVEKTNPAVADSLALERRVQERAKDLLQQLREERELRVQLYRRYLEVTRQDSASADLPYGTSIEKLKTAIKDPTLYEPGQYPKRRKRPIEDHIEH